MDLYNMTKQELDIRFKMIDELHKLYLDIKPRCKNCTKWSSSINRCEPWGEVPPEVQKEGCPEWQYDAIPF